MIFHQGDASIEKQKSSKRRKKRRRTWATKNGDPRGSMNETNQSQKGEN